MSTEAYALRLKVIEALKLIHGRRYAHRDREATFASNAFIALGKANNEMRESYDMIRALIEALEKEDARPLGDFRQA